MIKDLFEPFLDRERLLESLGPFGESHLPTTIHYRNGQLDALASVLSSPLQYGTPRHAFLFGGTGTGKTLVVKAVLSQLKQKGIILNRPIHTVYVNCHYVNTDYRLLTHIANSMVDSWSEMLPFTGLPTERVLARLLELKEDRTIVLALDNLDYLIHRAGPEILFDLSHLASISIIGVTVDVQLLETMDHRIRSSLSEKKIVFPSYDAEQLERILTDRAVEALKPGCLDPGTIPFVAALSARAHGDARQALFLLRDAVEVAEIQGATVVIEPHVKQAMSNGEISYRIEQIRGLTLHQEIILACLLKFGKTNYKTNSGELYEIYKIKARSMREAPVSSRRIFDLLTQMDNMGLIRCTVTSKGRRGRTRIIELTCPDNEVKEVLDEREMGRMGTERLSDT